MPSKHREIPAPEIWWTHSFSSYNIRNRIRQNTWIWFLENRMNKDRQRRHAANDVAATDNRTGRGDCPVIVVGIGASAGGLKSLKELFAKMPSGHGVAFVVIQHLDPSQENLTVKLLADQTALAVVEATDGMPVLPDRIHVMPPDKFLNITECRLTLQEPVYCNGLRMPIDHFFCSLAADQRRRGCGIVLSGSGQRRHPGTVGDQGRGRQDARGGPRQRRGPPYAAKRDRRGRGGHGSAGGGHGRSDCGAGGAGDRGHPQRPGGVAGV